MPRIYADINSEILRWARNRAHYPEDVLAKKVGVLPKKYRQWESGQRKPTMIQLHKLVLALKRPLLIFFMDEIPEEPEVLSEMRRLPGSDIGNESPELAIQVQLALERRDITLQLYNDLRQQPPRIDIKINRKQNPERIAQSLRESLGVTIEEQALWQNPYQAIHAWRTAIEQIGTLVFHIPQVSLQEMRGFSITIQPLPIIGINSTDSPRGRIFSLLHEFSHILLGDTILHAPRNGWFKISQRIATEYFCNNVAAAVLVPQNDLAMQVKELKQSSNTWSNQEIDHLVLRYKVSRSVIIRRLHKFDFIDDILFESLRKQYDLSKPPSRPNRPGGNFYATKISHLGTLLPSLAFRGYYDNKLTVSDLSSILGLKVPYLGKLEQKVLGFNYGFSGT